MCSLHGIVQKNDGVGTEIGLVGELVFKEGEIGKGSEVHGLIPSDTVVVDVDFAEHLHHFKLIFVSVECTGVFVNGGGFNSCFVRIGFGVVVGVWEGEGVGYFEHAIVSC